MKIDIYNKIKEKNKPLSKFDLRESLIDLFQNVLRDPDLSDEDKNTIARLRAYVDIHLKP